MSPALGRLLVTMLLLTIGHAVAAHAADSPESAIEQLIAEPKESRGKTPWIPIYSTRSESPVSIAPATKHPDAGAVQSIRCSGQFASVLPGEAKAAVHSPEDSAAVVQFDVLPRANSEAWFGLGYNINRAEARPQDLGPIFGFSKGQFAIRKAGFGDIVLAPLRKGDTLDHWYRMRLVIDFKANQGQGAAVLQITNLSKQEKTFSEVISSTSLGLDKLPQVSRNPMNWNAMYIRAGLSGSRLHTEFANLTPVAGRGIPDAPTLRLSALPQDHPHQQELVRFLATLTESDFKVELLPFRVIGQPLTPAENYKLFLLNSIYASPDTRPVRFPAEHFTLSQIEQRGQVMIPGVPGSRRSRPDAVSYAWYATWDFPGNPYFGSRAMKLRAFVCNAVDMLMLERSHDENRYTRSDYLGGTLIWLSWGYLQFRDVLPPEARLAYETGLRRMVDRLNTWGPTGMMVDMDLFVLVSMPYICQVFPDDPQIQKTAREIAHRLISNPRYFHPAGYFTDHGCFDVTYNGISLFMLTWSAALTDWPFVHEALAKAYRLRSHMVLPEVGGGWLGPSHFSSRTSGDAAIDQWGWIQRDLPAAALTDEALPALGMRAAEGLSILGTDRLARARRDLVAVLNRTTNEPSSVTQAPWVEAHWTGHPCYAILLVNDALLARLTKLRDEASPLLLPAAARQETYIRDFGSAIFATKTSRYAAILHTGSVGAESGITFHGLGGGTLSAFGTPATGPLILGRRAGYQGPKKPDHYEEAPLWPVHAVTLRNSSGAYFSTARCRTPKVESHLDRTPATIEVNGSIPSRKINGKDGLEGQITYSRKFTLSDQQLDVCTTISGDGNDSIQEMFETLPVYLGNASSKSTLPAEAVPDMDESIESQPVLTNIASSKAMPPLEILAEQNGNWIPLKADVMENIQRLRIRRHTGVVELKLETPGRVQLSPQDWQDRFQTKATCRNILIHVPRQPATPGPGQTWTARIAWTLTPLP
jgi:hypothetical protein